MFWEKRNVRQNEAYRLINEIEKARKQWLQLQNWRLSEDDLIHGHTTHLLAECRYRYLLRQARSNGVTNYGY